MNRLIFAAWSFGLLLPLASLKANDLVVFPTGPAAWTIDVANSANRPSSQPLGGNAISKVEVTQNDQVCRNLVTYYTGKSRVTWSIPHSSLLLTEDPNGTAFLTPTSIFFNVPFLPSTFSWLAPGLQQEKTPVQYEGKSCFHYKGPGGEAWIDSKTLFPVGLDDGTYLATFTLLPPPTTPLVLPPKFKKVLDGYTKVMGVRQTQ